MKARSLCPSPSGVGIVTVYLGFIQMISFLCLDCPTLSVRSLCLDAVPFVQSNIGTTVSHERIEEL